jgi:hypothetical protein
MVGLAGLERVGYTSPELLCRSRISPGLGKISVLLVRLSIDDISPVHTRAIPLS